MSRLEAEFGDRVDFIHIDWDDPDSREMISVYGVPRRSSYIILDAAGEVVWTYVGELDFTSVAAEIESVLDQ